MQRRPLDVDDVHAHLDAARARELEPDRLHARKPPARLAHRGRDGLGDGEVVRLELDVVRHERPPGTDENDAGPRIDLERPEVRAQLIRVDPPRELFEASTAEERGPPATPHLAVEEHGDAELRTDALGDLEGRAACLGEVGGNDRDERDDVRGADARVDALVPAQVDAVARRRDPGDEGVDEAAPLTHEHEDGPVMVLVGVEGEEAGAGRECVSDLRDRRRIATLGHVRHRQEHDPYPTAR